MSQLHIFIDGSWLYKVVAPERVLAAKTENPTQAFRLDFQKLDRALLKHVQKHDAKCTATGDRFLSTSVFSIPADLDKWPDEDDTILPAQIERAQRGIFARNRFVKTATDVGYSEEAVYRPMLRPWILEKLTAGQYQEKQVDATVVALLVRSSIVNPNDYHCVITGDADILPAIKVAYPKYSQNVLIATTHPDELRAEHLPAEFWGRWMPATPWSRRRRAAAYSAS